MALNINKVINKATATVTDDYEDRKELRDPEHLRPRFRFALTLGMATVLILAIIILVKSQPKTKLSRESYIDSRNLPGFSPLTSGKVPNDDGDTASIWIHCPCSRQSFSWINFIEVFTIEKDSNGQLKKNTLNANGTTPTICNFGNVNYEAERYICKTQLRPFIESSDQRTFIQSTNLLPPVVVQNGVFVQMRTSLLIQSDVYEYLDLETKTQPLYIYYRFMYALVGAMIDQQRKNVSSSVDDFWEASREFYKHAMQVLQQTLNVTAIEITFNTEIALGMSMSWDKYEQMCHPTFCDHVREYSLISKIFYAVSQVGGFLSITLFIVRAMIWPAVCSLLSFPKGEA